MHQLSSAVFVAALMLAPACGPPVPPGARVDVSGVHRYWDIEASLVHGGAVPASQWDALFATPGYAALEAREHRRADLTLAIRLAAVHALHDSAAAAVRRGGFLGRATAHLLAANTLRDSLRAALPGLEVQFRAEIRAGRQAVAELLGRDVVDRHPPPKLALVLFAPDGRGYPHLIVGDLLHLIRQPQRVGFFGHELFHYYRHVIARRERRDPGALQPWLDAVTNVEEEGLADQFDKRAVLALGPEQIDAMFSGEADRQFYRDYQQDVRDGAPWIHFADSALGAMPQEDSAALVAGRRFASALPIGGRALGAYMALTIAAHSNIRALGPLAGDPIAFWLAYDRAATALAGTAPALSPGARRTLSRLDDLLGPRDSGASGP
jgi:Putative zinc dependent peptidase (DUF5700)